MFLCSICDAHLALEWRCFALTHVTWRLTISRCFVSICWLSSLSIVSCFFLSGGLAIFNSATKNSMSGHVRNKSQLKPLAHAASKLFNWRLSRECLPREVALPCDINIEQKHTHTILSNSSAWKHAPSQEVQISATPAIQNHRYCDKTERHSIFRKETTRISLSIFDKQRIPASWNSGGIRSYTMYDKKPTLPKTFLRSSVILVHS